MEEFRKILLQFWEKIDLKKSFIIIKYLAQCYKNFPTTSTYIYTRGILQKFCVADPFATKNHQIDLKPKKLYSPGYNQLSNIITKPSKAFFILINKFVDACSIPCRVFLFNCLSLQRSSFVRVRPTLNLYTYRFIFDFAILRTFSHKFHYPKHFLALKTK